MRSYESMLGLVRKTDIYEELRLGHMTLDNDEDRSTVRRTLVMQANDEIDLDILKAYLEAKKEYGDTEKTSGIEHCNLSMTRSQQCRQQSRKQ